MDESPTEKRELPRDDTPTIADSQDLGAGSASDGGQAAIGPTSTIPPLTRIGDYELQAEIGRGGMGVVYKALDVRLHRVVALKMLSGSVLGRPEDVQRFEMEAAAVAQLQHPGIVALYDIGSHQDRPYFSMEYVEGKSLAQRLEDGVLPGRKAAEYLEQIARAVAFAHEKGIIHRDLKPANILIDTNDRPKITDFGLAKSVEANSGQTRTGTVIGTPSYMSPEQANADKNLGPASDVYSLGAILYEMLTGHPPFIGETALATLHMVAYQDPVPPRQLNPEIDRDLETICLKCLEKDPNRRYESAAALADDLRRYLRGEPIAARRWGLPARLGKWARRNPGYAAALVITVVGLVAFAAYETHVAETERSLRKQEEEARKAAIEQKKLAEEARRIALANEQVSQHLYYVGRIQQAWDAWENADVALADRVLRTFDRTETMRRLRGWEWYFLRRLFQSRWLPDAIVGRVRAMTYLPAGRVLVVAGGNPLEPGQIRIWDQSAGKLIATLPARHENLVHAVATDARGRILATAGADAKIWLWSTKTWQPLARLAEHAAAVTAVAFAPDASCLVSGDADGVLRIWKRDTSGNYLTAHVAREHSAEIAAIAFDRTGDYFATASADETVRIWRCRNAKVEHTLRGHEGEVHAVVFAPSGKVLVSGGGAGPAGRGGQVCLWDVESGKLLRMHFGIGDRVLSLAVNSDAVIAAGDSNGQIHVWDAQRSSEAIRRRSDVQPIYALAFSPDGSVLAANGPLGSVRFWNRRGTMETFRIPSQTETTAIAFHPKDSLLASAGRFLDGTANVVLWDMRHGKRLRDLSGFVGNVLAVAFSPDGNLLASGGSDRRIRVFRTNDGTLLDTLTGHEGRITALAFDPKRDRLYSAGGEDHTLRIWEVGSGRELRRLEGGNGVLCLAVSRDGRLLAAGDSVGAVRVWDLTSPAAKPLVLQGPRGWIEAVVFSPDGAQLACANSNAGVQLWTLGESNPIGLGGELSRFSALAWHPSGNRLAAAGADRRVTLWDLSTLQVVFQLEVPDGPLRSVAFSADGRTLAAAGDHTGVVIWVAAREK